MTTNHVPMLQPFSPKQCKALRWWADDATKGYDAIVCDGAIRSGKTTALALGFVIWSSVTFHRQSFAICGKTVTALHRNLITPLIPMLETLGFTVTERISRSYCDISFRGHSNRYYWFGGKDEASAALIQGITLGGVLMDEVALMPRSFVEQALARCSVLGSRIWFSCNPSSPSHWFYREWILKRKEKNLLYLHFTMEDNYSLSPAIRRRYRRMYTGPFYERYINGRWVAAQGLIYPMFSAAKHIVTPPAHLCDFVVSADYGTMNPTSFGLWGRSGDKWYRMAEHYYDARKTGMPRTDEEHYASLEALVGNLPITKVVIDPSAASFIACIRRHGRFTVVPASNDVASGIQRVADALQGEKILFAPQCTDSIREFSLYAWDTTAAKDTPIKENDHAMDDIRYFVSTVLYQAEKPAFFAASLNRNQPNY